MLRIAPVFLGSALFLLAIIALLIGDHSWFTWALAVLAVTAWLTAGLVPAKTAAFAAAAYDVLVGMALIVVASVGFRTGVSPWMPWSALIVAAACVGTATALALQGQLERLRCPRDI